MECVKSFLLNLGFFFCALTNFIPFASYLSSALDSCPSPPLNSVSVVMAFATVLAFMAAMTSLHVCMGVVYKVGDSSGWTTVGGVDYRKWAASKTFNVGDTIVFEYNPEYHDVIRVGYQDYKACHLPVNPVAVYTKGNDSFAIKAYGHYFFICGKPGHCQAGQKVDIRVVRPSPPAKVITPLAPSPLPSSSPFASPAPSPLMEATPSSPDEESASTKLHVTLTKLHVTLGMHLLIFVGLAYMGM